MIETATLSEFDVDGRTPVFDSPYTVVLGLEAGEGVPPHTHPDKDILFSVQEGALAVTVGTETVTLEAGEFARFDGEKEISAKAVETSRALVVLVDQ